MTDARTPPSDRLKALAAAFQALTFREMTDLADVFSEALAAQNGLQVRPQVFAEVLDSLGEYLEIEIGETD